jgi:hypothetical protein
MREPCESRYRPRRRTAPTTSTTTREDGSPVTPAPTVGGRGRGAAVVVVPRRQDEAAQEQEHGERALGGQESRPPLEKDSGMRPEGARETSRVCDASCRKRDEIGNDSARSRPHLCAQDGRYPSLTPAHQGRA